MRQRPIHLRRYAVPVVLAALLAACGASRHPPQSPQPSLATIAVQPRQAAREQTWDGVVEAVDATTIAAQTNARVLELPFDVGDRVRKGDVLVRFSDVEQQSGRRAASANVAAARAELRDAEANWKRTDAIFQRGLIARAQLDAAVARRDSARAALAAAEAALRSAGQQADYTVLRAPFDGVITQRFVHVGEAVQSGPPTPQPLIALAALDALRVDVVVPQGAIDAIRASPRASVVLDDGKRVQAARVTVFPYADPGTHSFRVRVELPAGGSGLYPGMTVKAAFAVGQATRLLVPVGALVRRGELSAVYVVGADHSVGLRQLRLGHRIGDEVEVLAGLAPGDHVARDPEAAALYLTRQHGGNASP
jgi:RND family efflux transporter MFP subunit